MKSFFIAFFSLSLATSLIAQKAGNKELNDFFTRSFDELLALSPMNATSIGDNRYNDQLPVEFTDSYREQFKTKYKDNLQKLSAFKRENLTTNDQLSYDIFKWTMTMNLEGLQYKFNRIPFNQFFGLPLSLAQLGSGTVVQPFKTIKDYENWISRVVAFPAWADSAIIYFKKGIDENIVLPTSLVQKMIPQLEGFITTDPAKSVFYGPVKNFPSNFSETDRQRLTADYTKMINEQIIPSYKKLADFIRDEYLPKARSSSGLHDVSGGDKMYSYNLRQITTTKKTAEQIYKIGLAEVKRIRAEMVKVKNVVGFTGSLESFFEYMRTDPKFYPYKTAEEILDAYRSIEQRIAPNLQRMFLDKPKTSFEVRQIESFRAASAAAQYNAGLADGTRPGIFYVPIVDVSKTPVRESLFIHEAIPGHHYQIMLQRENESLPNFRRYGGFTSYVEGWGLYSESLGKELGLYTDPYQYMKALGDEIHRAIRLVVDPAIHTKGWTREQAIKYMMDNEPITEASATAEIERYMAIPGQATAYKIGELKLQELRKRYSKQMGQAFEIARFHQEILKDGALPLEILESKMNKWARQSKK